MGSVWHGWARKELTRSDMERSEALIRAAETRAPHGAREMPVWGLEFYFANPKNPQQAKEADVLVGKLVEYLRSLQQ